MTAEPTVRVGGAAIHAVLEMEPLLPAENILADRPGMTLWEAGEAERERARAGAAERLRARLREAAWVCPRWATAEGELKLSFRMFVIITPGGRRICVDTCVGDGKDRAFRPAAHRKRSAFLSDLRRAGCDPDAVDFVLCTHLHWDHVGFNTTFRDGRWVPTFPNARYLWSQKEWEWFEAEARRPEQRMVGMRESMQDSVMPIVAAGLATPVAGDHVLVSEPGCVVRLRATPGHTPGHVSVVVESGGETGVITGDCVHSPLQLAFPGIGTPFDTNWRQGVETRRKLLGEVAARGAVLLGTHFRDPCAGTLHAVADGGADGGYVFRPVAAAGAGGRHPPRL